MNNNNNLHANDNHNNNIILNSDTHNSNNYVIDTNKLNTFMDKFSKDIIKEAEINNSNLNLKQTLDNWKQDIKNTDKDVLITNINQKLLLKNFIELESANSPLEEYLASFYLCNTDDDVKNTTKQFDDKFTDIFCLDCSDNIDDNKKSILENSINLLEKYMKLSIIDNNTIQILVSLNLCDILNKYFNLDKLLRNQIDIINNIYLEYNNFILLLNNDDSRVKLAYSKLIITILINANKNYQENLIFIIIKYLLHNIVDYTSNIDVNNKKFIVNSNSSEKNNTIQDNSLTCLNSEDIKNNKKLDLYKNTLINILTNNKLSLLSSSTSNSLIFQEKEDTTLTTSNFKELFNTKSISKNNFKINIDSKSNFIHNLLIGLSNNQLPLKLSCLEILHTFIILADTKTLTSIYYSKINELILEKISIHLIDFFPQMRYYTLLFAKLYYMLIQTKFNIKLLNWELHSNDCSITNKLYFLENILPKICLNRYYPAEGIKNTSLDLWKYIVDNNGIKIIENNFNHFLYCYLSELKSYNLRSKEAALRCTQELFIKVYNTNHFIILDKCYTAILDGLIISLKDKNPNVRLSCLNAAGYIMPALSSFCYGDDLYSDDEDSNNNSKEMFLELFVAIKLSLFDNIYEVRDSAGYCIKTLTTDKSNNNYFLNNLSIYFNKFKDSFKSAFLIDIKDVKYYSLTNCNDLKDFFISKNKKEYNESYIKEIHDLKCLCYKVNNYIFN